MKLTLPPLPSPYASVATIAEMIRARDLEVVRVVLEAAAQAASPEDSYRDEWFNAKADAVKRIRALEVVHG